VAGKRLKEGRNARSEHRGEEINPLKKKRIELQDTSAIGGRVHARFAIACRKKKKGGGIWEKEWAEPRLLQHDRLGLGMGHAVVEGGGLVRRKMGKHLIPLSVCRGRSRQTLGGVRAGLLKKYQKVGGEAPHLRIASEGRRIVGGRRERNIGVLAAEPLHRMK